MSDTNPVTSAPTPKKNRTLLYIIAIIALLGLNVYMYINNSNKNTTIATTKEDMRVLDSSFTQLKRDYQKSLAEIEQYKGENAALDSLVAVKQYALEAKKSELQQYINKKNLTEEELAKAKKLLLELKAEVETYKAQIADLTDKYNKLSVKYDTSQAHLNRQTDVNKQLSDENTILNEKVAIGSIFRVSNVKGSGVKGSGSKEKETSSVKHLESIKISFDVNENKVTDAGEKAMEVRIIDPSGSTLQSESQGSGTVTMKESEKTIPYSLPATFMYNNKAKTVSVYWKPNGKDRMTKGTYKIEIFQNGYLVGKSEFKLSSGLF